MSSISFVLLIVLLVGSALSVPTAEPDWSIGKTFEEDDFCTALGKEKSNPKLGPAATRGSKLLCNGRSDDDFVDKVFKCGEDDVKSTKSFLGCLDKIGPKGQDAPCSNWGQYFKCGVGKLGSACGGKDADKIIAFTIDYAYAAKPELYPSVFKKCNKEILGELQSLYA